MERPCWLPTIIWWGRCCYGQRGGCWAKALLHWTGWLAWQGSQLGWRAIGILQQVHPWLARLNACLLLADWCCSIGVLPCTYNSSPGVSCASGLTLYTCSQHNLYALGSLVKLTDHRKYVILPVTVVNLLPLDNVWESWGDQTVAVLANNELRMYVGMESRTKGHKICPRSPLPSLTRQKQRWPGTSHWVSSWYTGSACSGVVCITSSKCSLHLLFLMNLYKLRFQPTSLFKDKSNDSLNESVWWRHLNDISIAEIVKTCGI